MTVQDKKWSLVIRPQNGWFDLHLKEIIHYRDLIMLFVKRTFVSQYKQTVLGPAWAVIQPLLTTLVFTIIFGNIAKLPTDGIPSFLFYMCGNVAWGYFSGCLTTTATTFTSNSSIFGKVYFPRLVMPVATVVTQLISFAIQLVFFVIIYLFYVTNPAYGISPNIYLLLVPLLIIQMAMLSLGVGIIISAVTTKYRDLVMLISFAVNLWMYLTPVAYASSLIPAQYMTLYMLNPMTPIIETFRYAFFGSGVLSLKYLGISFAVTFVLLFLGIVMFSRVEKTFMDTV